jgi:hypothetical protein
MRSTMKDTRVLTRETLSFETYVILGVLGGS